MTGLADIVYNNSASTVIILDNSITGMTGHQHNPTTGYNIKGDPAAKIDLEALCKAMGVHRVRVVDPYDLSATDTAVREELAADEPSVIISRRPCALLKNVNQIHFVPFVPLSQRPIVPLRFLRMRIYPPLRIYNNYNYYIFNTYTCKYFRLIFQAPRLVSI